LLLQAGPATQLFETEQVSRSSPLVTGLHVPPVFAQLWQVPLQAMLQHLLSEHWPVTQSVPKLHPPPCLVLQTPLASQICAPMQVVPAVSSAFMMATHAPPPPVQAWHCPHALGVQQRPSTQLPVVHVVPALQVSPGLLLQVPATQVWVPTQVPSSPLRFSQAPPAAVQAWQVGQVAEPQQ
jgi:hypothetical protein